MFNTRLFFRSLFIVFVIILVAILIFVSWFFIEIGRSGHRTTQVRFTIQQGWSVQVIAQKLSSEGIISSPFSFVFGAYIEGRAKDLKAGEYIIPTDASLRGIISLFSQGQTEEEVQITILEGWSNMQIAEYLQKHDVVSVDDFLAVAQSKDLKNLFPDITFPSLADKSASADLQGYLYPDTYRIFIHSTAKDIVLRLLTNFERKLTNEDRFAIAKQGKSIFDVIRLASIVEKEERKKTDKPIVAGVFLKRLSIGMPLQSDATINYITQKGDVTPSSQDLAVDSPYNTYKYPGLPPEPITNPSIETIRAVIHATPTEYLYFLHAPNGQTVYAKTYEEHLANKAKYLK